ncbi:MAG: Rha family transcriptional regulator [Clostridium sp.]|jgi:phage regulator Rha-like protein|uniref:Rha family transcriptional regulator n=1 Tax=Clostridium sp. TaxID=1506 RepID=UPI0025BA0836|nr:Rha family transcriptional regulator [Clostridium sp.]MCH3965468.1 Rha family transcriptional regulator [Clostridium sp.]MCI2202804.1 Rha family transcriptional regulator [Clostridium sp.]
MDKPIDKNKPETLDSLEVAKMVGKSHKNLLRDIDTYIKQMGEANKEILKANSKNEDGSKVSTPIKPDDYFVESTYVNSQNKGQPCYEISKMGCDFIAHKLNGTKGTEFTATYIKRFYEMEQNQYKIPTYPEALRLYADEYERSEKLQIENTHKQSIIDGLTKDIPLASKRKLVNKAVRYGCSDGTQIEARWNLLYGEFKDKYGIDVKKRYKNYVEADEKPKLKYKLDYVDKVLDMIPELFEIACVLYEGDIKELEQKMFNLRENKNVVSV